MSGVALIDDHGLVRGAFATLLEQQADFSVVVQATRVEDALVSLKAAPAPPDLAVLDLNLPGASGMEAVNMLRRSFPDLRILICSERVDPLEVHQVLRAGVCGFISKYSAPEELLTGLRSVIQGGVYLSSDVTRALTMALQHEQPTAVHLSDRELEVLRQCARGMTTREIAETLCLSPRTVEKHRSSVLQKLDCRNLVEALERARGLGLL